MHDVSVAGWIGSRLAPLGSCIGALVPTGFEAYARLRDPDPWVQGENALSTNALSALVEVIGRRYSRPYCYFGVWDGHAWVNSPRSESPLFAEDVLEAPKVRLPGRNYILFEGPLEAALRIGPAAGPSGESGQTPDLIWPSGCSWLIAADIDLDFAYIGATNALIQDVLADDRLVASSVSAMDPLAEDPDRLKFSYSGDLPGLPEGYSFTVTAVERDHREIRVAYEITPQLRPTAPQLSATARDDRGLDYFPRCEFGYSAGENRSHGAVGLPLPALEAQSLRLRLSWGSGEQHTGSQALELKIEL